MNHRKISYVWVSQATMAKPLDIFSVFPTLYCNSEQILWLQSLVAMYQKLGTAGTNWWPPSKVSQFPKCPCKSHRPKLAWGHLNITYSSKLPIFGLNKNWSCPTTSSHLSPKRVNFLYEQQFHLGMWDRWVFVSIPLLFFSFGRKGCELPPWVTVWSPDFKPWGNYGKNRALRKMMDSSSPCAFLKGALALL